MFNWHCWIMTVNAGNVGGEDDTIRIAGDCQDQIYHGLKYTLGIGQFLPSTSKASFE